MDAPFVDLSCWCKICVFKTQHVSAKNANFVAVFALEKHNQTDYKWHNKVDGVSNPTLAFYCF